MAATIEGRVRELIEAPNFCFIGTVRRDGSAHVTPTWVDLDGDQILLNTAEGRAWPAQLRRAGRVTLTIPDKDNIYEFVEIRGRLAGDTQEGADDHIDVLAKKYLGQDEYPFRRPDEVRILFRIEPESVRYYGGG